MMAMLGPMASHEQKSHAASHFDHLYRRKAMVALMTPLASHEQKCHAASHFDHLGDANGSISGIT